MHSIGTWWMWGSFFIFVLLVLAIDLFLVGGNRSHKVSAKEALLWFVTWVSCALIFNGIIWWYVSMNQGAIIAHQKALEFFTGYLIEQSLSIDNMFAFIMIFNYFRVPEEFQRRVLLYGILSAVILRLMMILGGTWLVSQFQWVLYFFGVFLIFTGIKMLLPAKEEGTLDNNAMLRFIRNHMRITNTFHKERFFIRQNALWYATPLLLVLMLIEMSDIVFALDSIPAIFAITNDAFIIFTSNIFAILGLRALYFLLSDMAVRFRLLKYGVALVLVFIGIKMIIAYWLHLPILLALGIIVAILATTIILSMIIPARGAR